MKTIRKLAEDMRAALPGADVRFDEPLSRHTSFKIGGPAAAFAVPGSEAELGAMLGLLHRAGVTPLIIGNGTNLLVTDEPLRRFVIKIGDGLAGFERLGPTSLRAGAGMTLSRLAVLARGEGLGGLEFAHGIPGTVGGAVSMNAGAYGGEMRDVVVSAAFLREDGSAGERAGGDLGFSYRRSAFSGSGDLILSAVFELREDDPARIRAKMEELAERRRAAQPLDKPSAGSTFKRPANGYAAALIDEAGLKGLTVGGAAVSEKHAGFVVNLGGATFEDVVALMEQVRERVYAASGITLEPEVKIIRNP